MGIVTCAIGVMVGLRLHILAIYAIVVDVVSTSVTILQIVVALDCVREWDILVFLVASAATLLVLGWLPWLIWRGLVHVGTGTKVHPCCSITASLLGTFIIGLTR